MSADLLPLVVVAVAVAIAAVTDLRAFKICNALTIPLLLSGLAYHAAAGVEGVRLSGLGILTGFALTYPGYRIGGMGGGDMKLIAGVGAWLGALPTLGVFIAATIATGAYALVAVVIGGRVRETCGRLRAFARGHRLDTRVSDAVQRRDRVGVVPFGAMTAVGLAAFIAVTLWRPRS